MTALKQKFRASIDGATDKENDVELEYTMPHEAADILDSLKQALRTVFQLQEDEELTNFVVVIDGDTLTIRSSKQLADLMFDHGGAANPPLVLHFSHGSPKRLKETASVIIPKYCNSGAIS